MCNFAPAITPYLPLGAVKVWAQYFIGTASYNACFWTLETANFNNPVKDIAEWMLRTWLYNAPSVCREALVGLRTLHGCEHI